MESKMINIIKSLSEKTRKDQLEWINTSRDSEYQTLLSKSRITIDVWRDDSGNDLADLRIYNDEGVLIDVEVANSCEDEISYKIIAQLHMIIRRKSLKYDETIESIINDLSDEKIFRIPVKEDDPPF